MSPEEPIDMGPDEEPIPPLPSPLLPEPFTVYAHAYYTFADGTEAGPFTITVQIDTSYTASELAEALQEAVDALQAKGGVGYGFGGAVSNSYVIVAPTFFQYSTGI